jgi:putative SOS response-associated peptidase YedK
MRWGLIPAWAKDQKIGSRMFNARAETIAEKPSFRSAFQRRRCGIVVNAFYEWAEVDGVRVPHAFRVVGQEVFTLAGIWAEWRTPELDVVRTCSIVTCAANDQMKPYHDRMPVILDPPALEAWIAPHTTPEQLHQLMVPYAGKLSVERTTL